MRTLTGSNFRPVCKTHGVYLNPAHEYKIVRMTEDWVLYMDLNAASQVFEDIDDFTLEGLRFTN